MKTKKIILLIITLALVCVAGFSGLVGAFAETVETKVLSQPFADLFPPQSSDYVYFYFDFSQCGISSSLLEDTIILASFKAYDASITLYYDTYMSYALTDIVGFSLVYQLSVPKALILAYDMDNVTLSFLFPDLTSYGTPSIDYVNYVDSQDVLIGTPSLVGSNYFFIGTIDSSMSSCIVTFGNEFLAVVDSYLSLEGRYNNLQSQFETLQGDFEEANNTIDELETTIYNNERYIDALEEANQGLSQNYHNLQDDYNALETEYLNSKQNYENLLNVANNEIAALQHMVNEQPVAAGFGWIAYAFEKVGTILEIQLLPGISIGLLCLIPLVLGVVFFVLRLIRGE